MKRKQYDYYCIQISCFVLIFLIVLLSSPSLLHTEVLSLSSVSVFSFNSSNTEVQQCSVNFDDGIIIKLEEHIHSLIAVDIEILQSKASPASFIVYSVEGMPHNNDKKYKVQEIQKEEVQRKTSTFRIAYDEKVNCAQEPTIKLLSCTISEKKPPFLFRIAPSSSKESKQNKFSIKVKPILQDLGCLKFNLIYPTNIVYFPSLPKNEAEAKKNIAVRLDDKHITDFSKPCMTRTGEHKVQVDSHFYKSEVITCIVEKGAIELIDIELKPLAPLITIEGPSNVEVFFDELMIKLPFSANIEAGEHILKFRMEGYEAVRNILAEQGKKYLVNLALEINIIEK